MTFKSDTKRFRLISNEYDKVKYICSCGHRVIIPIWANKMLCHWCGKYVFKDKMSEFKYRVNEKMKGNN